MQSQNNANNSHAQRQELKKNNNLRLLLPLSMVDLNNKALSHFLHGDFEPAVDLLTTAFKLCQHKLDQQQEQISSKSCANRSASLPEVVTALDGNCWPSWRPNGASDVYNESTSDEEECEDHTSMSMEDDEESTTGSYNRMHQEEETLVVDLLDGLSTTSIHTDTPPSSRTNEPLHCCFSFPYDSAAIPSPNPSSPSAAFTIYNRALVLARKDEQDASLLIRTRSILLYNLALVHHNVGIHRGVSGAFWQALRLYEMAIESLNQHIPKPVQQQQHQQLQPPMTSWIWRLLDVEKLLLALLNNMGNIHAHLFHVEHTHACMNALRNVLEASTATTSLFLRNTTHTEDSTTTSYRCLTLDEDHMFFLLNSLFQGKELCFAPAA